MTSTATAAVGPDNDWADITASEAALRRFLHGLPGVDQVGAEARAAGLGTRSIKTTAKAYAIDLAIRMVDLTTLEGQDTPGKVRALAAKAMRPDPADPTCPATAAVCVYTGARSSPVATSSCTTRSSPSAGPARVRRVRRPT
jgi:deoxyribose-phosphate aldolase